MVSAIVDHRNDQTVKLITTALLSAGSMSMSVGLIVQLLRDAGKQEGQVRARSCVKHRGSASRRADGSFGSFLVSL